MKNFGIILVLALVLACVGCSGGAAVSTDTPQAAPATTTVPVKQGETKQHAFKRAMGSAPLATPGGP